MEPSTNNTSRKKTKVMTNFEWLHTLTPKQLCAFMTYGLHVKRKNDTDPQGQSIFMSSELLCRLYCAHRDGFLNWLHKEQEYEVCE